MLGEVSGAVVVGLLGEPSHRSPSGRYRAVTVSTSTVPSVNVLVRSVVTRVHEVPSGRSSCPVCSPSAQRVENSLTVIESRVVVGHKRTPYGVVLTIWRSGWGKETVASRP